MFRKLFCLVSVVLVLSFVLTTGVRADLVGWWRLDDGSGTTAIDSSGSGNDGTLNGDPKWVAGKVGGALEMDGGDFVEVPGVSEIAVFGGQERQVHRDHLDGDRDLLLHDYLLACFPDTLVTPGAEIAVHCLPGRKIVGQHAPGTATPQNIEDGIDNFSHVHTSATTTSFGRWNE